MHIENKNILITGGTSGIGRACAIKLAKSGANVVISGRNEEHGRIIVEQSSGLARKIKFIKCDVTLKNDVDSLFAELMTHFSHLDCAINNAGIEGEIAFFNESSEENWDNVVNTNLKGVWRCMKHELRLMLQQAHGSIINMSSTSGLVGNGFGMTAYAASKFAVIGLSKSVALEYAKHNIRVNAVCPGFVNTPMIDAICAKNPKLRRRFEATHPMGRMVTPEEVADMVVYLCSDEASRITGSALVIDGGLTA